MVEKTYLLSENKNDLAIALDDIIQFYASKKSISISEKRHLLPFDGLIDLTLFRLYDDELLLKNFPNGVVTENIILIPHNIIENFIKELKEVKIHLQKRHVEDKIKTMLNINMSSFLENVLNVDFTEKEKEILNIKY